MSSSTPASNSTAWTADQSGATHVASPSPWRRTWLRFKRQRLGYWSLVIFVSLFVISLFGEVLSNDRPLIVRYDGHYYFPIAKDYSEKIFGGDFPARANYLDPYIRSRLESNGNFAIYPPNHFHYDTIDYFADLIGQRLIEIWSSMPDLYLLIIFASIFEPTLWLLFILLSMFGWLVLSDYVRAEFLRNRSLDYVRAARTMGLSNWQIMWRHVLPNSLTPVITFLPFRMSAAILSLTSLDFLGLGVPPPTPSLGELLQEGKNNLDAWWISISAFAALVITLLLLTFMGDALRNALDARKRGSAFGGGPR